MLDGVETAKLNIANVDPNPGKAFVMGNTSFGNLQISNKYLYQYVSTDPMLEKFKPVGSAQTNILPTTAFILANAPGPQGKQPISIMRTGEIDYGKDNTSSNLEQDGIPTVGGGNDLFVTSIAGGINVAVAAPQNVRVLSSSGAVIYSGHVTTAVDIKLPTNGIYIVSGENEVQKILF